MKTLLFYARTLNTRRTIRSDCLNQIQKIKMESAQNNIYEIEESAVMLKQNLEDDQLEEAKANN